MKKLVKGLLSLNIASAIRLARFGPNDARRRLSAAYRQIDPFGRPDEANGTTHDEGVAGLARIPEVAITAVK